MCSPGDSARDRVLAELAGLGPAGRDAVPAPGGGAAVTLLGQVKELAGFIDQAQGQLARLAAALDTMDGAAELGYASAAAFLRRGCGRSAGRAGELVATGRGLRRLPATGKALAAGEISFDAAHVICRAAALIGDDDLAGVAEEQLLALARNRPAAGTQPPHEPPTGEPPANEPPAEQPPADERPADERPAEDGPPDGGAGDGGAGDSGAARDAQTGAQTGPGSGPGPAGVGLGGPALDPGQLRALGEELAYRANPQAVEDKQRKRFERRHLSFGFTLDDTGTLTGACGDTLSLEIIKTAVHAFGPPLGSEDVRTAAQRRMDGLTAACAAALDSGSAGTRHGAAPHLSIMVDETTLADTGAPAGAPWPGTPGPGPAGGPGAAAPDSATTWPRTPGPGPAGGPGAAAPDSATTRPGTPGHAGDPSAGAPCTTEPCGPCTAANCGTGGTESGTAAPGTGTPGTGTAPDHSGTGPGSGTAGSPGPGLPPLGGTGDIPARGTPGTAGTAGTAGLPGPPPARTGYGALLTARQVLALACRADLSVIRWSDGIPLDVGRRYRTETPALRRALEARDQGCRAPGCGMPAAWSTAHHLKPWSQGGTTSLSDTALFCFVHHMYFIHLLGWTVTGNPNGTLHFTHPGGWLTLDSPLPATKPRAP